MPLLILGLILTVGLVLVLRGFLLADPRLLAQCLRWSAIVVAGLAALLLLDSGRGGLLLTLALLAVPLMLRRWQRRGGGGGAAAPHPAPGHPAPGHPAPGQSSQVETRLLHMTLDHDSGALTGTVIEGRFAGQRLEQLDFAELMALRDEANRLDGPSVSVLEAWLDRTQASDWRTRGTTDHSAESGGVMTPTEARAILGLPPEATPDAVRDAHRRLMAKVHPDHGGSTWLAAKLNQARAVLLNS